MVSSKSSKQYTEGDQYCCQFVEKLEHFTLHSVALVCIKGIYYWLAMHCVLKIFHYRIQHSTGENFLKVVPCLCAQCRFSGTAVRTESNWRFFFLLLSRASLPAKSWDYPAPLRCIADTMYVLSSMSLEALCWQSFG